MLKNILAARAILFTLACGIVIASSSAVAKEEQPGNASEFIKNAGQAYYSLNRERMGGFECKITPDWEVILKSGPEKDPKNINTALAKLNQLQFMVRVDANGNAKVSHNEIAATNDKMKEGLSGIYSGMEQMTVGFFQTWSFYMIYPPLPEPQNKVTLEKVGVQYRISYKEGDAADVVTTMNKDLVVMENKVKAKDFNSVVQPKFRQSA